MTVTFPTVPERRILGLNLRKKVNRLEQGTWIPARRDPVEIVLASNKDRLPDLIPLKMGRMSVSPFAFFRGSASLMAADLAQHPVTGLQVQICGDAHLRNLGAYAAPDGHLVFDLNDFDETTPGPWEWDLKRLATSAVLCGREAGAGLVLDTVLLPEQRGTADTCAATDEEGLLEAQLRLGLSCFGWIHTVGEKRGVRSVLLTLAAPATRLLPLLCRSAHGELCDCRSLSALISSADCLLPGAAARGAGGGAGPDGPAVSGGRLPAFGDRHAPGAGLSPARLPSARGAAPLRRRRRRLRRPRAAGPPHRPPLPAPPLNTEQQLFTESRLPR